jgi:exonuclease VII large subunit
MGVWKSFVDRMKDKREELQRKAVKKAAQTALDSAGKAVDLAGKAVERALFGNLDDDDDAKKGAPPPPDPFAKLKAREAERKEQEREEKRRAKEAKARELRLEKEVDSDLAALKKRLGSKE